MKYLEHLLRSLFRRHFLSSTHSRTRAHQPAVSNPRHILTMTALTNTNDYADRDTRLATWSLTCVELATGGYKPPLRSVLTFDN